MRRDRERRRMYNKSKLGSAKAQLRIVSQSYGDMVRTFLFQVDAGRDDLYAGTLVDSDQFFCS